MAESIVILFKNAKWVELIPTISEFAEHIDSTIWVYPKNDKNYTISLYEYDSWIDECDDEDIETLMSISENLPTSILCIELRRSRQNQACDDATKVCKMLLAQFKGIVDDAWGEFWELEKIEGSKAFLEQYKFSGK